MAAHHLLALVLQFEVEGVQVRETFLVGASDKNSIGVPEKLQGIEHKDNHGILPETVIEIVLEVAQDLHIDQQLVLFKDQKLQIVEIVAQEGHLLHQMTEVVLPVAQAALLGHQGHSPLLPRAEQVNLHNLKAMQLLQVALAGVLDVLVEVKLLV